MREALEVVDYNEEEEDCKSTSPRKIREKQPKYNLNQEKFLSAFVARGPNNQIYSLRETIYVAIALNRTLILPPFFKHDRGDPTSNGSNTAIVDFEQRIDIQKLTKLIPVVFTSEAAEKCPEGFDNIFGVHNVCHSKENPREWQ
ncbi:Oidioi.mRNA.OKI2018_I69.chr1.g1246.t1.cds [Oikopleura dioica]|uniref:Oidioi.mRNA.OKI2018_I69.chr1.g1246.t1.cds n=1 Tax=Oikopleura dioica TaxID=34765 RepID=A0ABN7SUD9_OIKDI|nr:Oidioi.mRNA.OKI2018_I69.chr1.g1246.t1.cds [Oikopleura dioica]